MKYLKPKSIPRRKFLKSSLSGAASIMALPYLEIMIPSLAQAQTSNFDPNLKFVSMFFPFGLHFASVDNMPAGSLNPGNIPYILKPIESLLANEITMLTGLNIPDIPYEMGRGHGCAGSVFMTGVRPLIDPNRFGATQSIDQKIADFQASQPNRPRIRSIVAHYCRKDRDEPFGRFHPMIENRTSWRNSSTYIEPIEHPKQIFRALFSGLENSPEQEALREKRKSVLDIVKEDAERVKKLLGRADTQTLDQYFQEVRDLELRLGLDEDAPPEFECSGYETLKSQMNSVPESRLSQPETWELNFRTIALALQCNVTRVASMSLGATHGDPHIGQYARLDGRTWSEDYHKVSHYIEIGDRYEDKFKEGNRYYLQYVRDFIDRMKSTPDGSGNLYSNSVVYFGSGERDGNFHYNHRLPIFLGGQGSGIVRAGRHIRYDENHGNHYIRTGNSFSGRLKGTDLARLFINIQNAFGIAGDEFAGIRGRLQELG